MEVLGINNQSTRQVKRPGFWRRQFAAEVTEAQLVFDVFFGIVGPILCFVFDPFVFRAGGYLGGGPLLPQAKPFVYLISGFEMLALMLWLIAGPSHYWKRQTGGILVAGGVLSLTIGLLLLPFSTIGTLFYGIGLLGFTPFVTGIIYLRNGYRAIKRAVTVASPARRGAPVLAGFVLAISLPALVGVTIHQAVMLSIDAIIQGDPERVSASSEVLRWLSPLTGAELGRIVNAYEAERDPVRRERLRKSYSEITGEDIETRLRRLRD